MNNPTIPKAIRPPITPANIIRIGRSAPLLIKNGRMKLSEAPTIIDRITSTVPQTGSPDTNCQTYTTQNRLN